MLAGLEAAQAHPELRPIKVNAVALRGFTEDEVLRFAAFAREKPYEVRFIEFMPLDADQAWDEDKVLPNAEVRAIIESEYELVPLGRERHGTARRYAFADGKGEIGFISPVSEPFCGDCNRIRLTAEGFLRTCLFSMNETDLRAPLRAGRERRASSSRSSATRSGARSSSTTSASPASCSPRARCRGSAADAARDRARRGSGSRRWPRRSAPSACRSPRPPAAWPRRTPCSAVDLPPFDRSAMDGYAVRAGRHHGAPMRIAGEVAAGEVGRSALEPGTALGITTGAALPPGADAILRVEDARRRGRRAARRGAAPAGPPRALRGRGRRARRRARPGRRRAHACSA